MFSTYSFLQIFVFDLYVVDDMKKKSADLPFVKDLFFDLFGKLLLINTLKVVTNYKYCNRQKVSDERRLWKARSRFFPII